MSSTQSHQELGELVRRARQGDRAAFEALYHATVLPLYYRTLSFLGDKEAAQDIIQQTYLLLWQKLDGLQRPETVVAWLNRTAQLQCYQHVDRARRRSAVPLCEAILDRQWQEADAGVSLPEQQAEQRDTYRRLREACAALESQQRLLILLRYDRRLTVREISAATHLSESTVKRTLRAALKKLRGQLGAVVPAGLLGFGLRRSGISAGGPFGGRRHFHFDPAKVLAAVAGAAALSAAGLYFAGSPRIQMETDSTLLRNTPLTAQIQVSGPIAAQTVVATDSCGQIMPLQQVSDGRFLLQIAQNGHYTVTATAASGRSRSAALQVDCIDTQPPVLSEVGVRGRDTVLTVDDGGSGVDQISCVGADGRVFAPVWQEGCQYGFSLPAGDYQLHAADLAGNAVQRRVVVHEEFD